MKLKPPLSFIEWPGPLGAMLLAASDAGVAGIWFSGQQHGPDASGWRADAAHPLLHSAVGQLDDYFAGRRRHFELPLDLRSGTAFQQSVWQALRAIAPGRTCSYGDLARRIGRPSAVRAVGAAVGRNPIGIVVPCHRVIGAGGALTGYAGGIERKQALLRLEGAL